MRNLKTILVALAIIASLSVSAQELKGDDSSISINEFPEYVIIQSQNTKFLGGIGIIIYTKKSIYEEQLLQLQFLLQNKKQLNVRTQIDLLNAMSKLGFEYVDAYNAETVVPMSKDDSLIDDVFSIADGGEGAFKVNIVFRKKEKYRN